MRSWYFNKVSDFQNEFDVVFEQINTCLPNEEKINIRVGGPVFMKFRLKSIILLLFKVYHLINVVVRHPTLARKNVSNVRPNAFGT